MRAGSSRERVPPNSWPPRAANGSTLWSAELGAFGYAVPMTYRTRGGKQFVVIATGGEDEEGALVAFLLP